MYLDRLRRKDRRWRGQSPEPVPAKLYLPAPEELGIRLYKPEPKLDWNLLRDRLERLGASRFQLERLGTKFRFECTLPTGVVEGVGDTEAAAVRSALDR